MLMLLCYLSNESFFPCSLVHPSASPCMAMDCTVCSGNLIWRHLWLGPASVQRSGAADRCGLAEAGLGFYKTCVKYSPVLNISLKPGSDFWVWFFIF